MNPDVNRRLKNDQLAKLPDNDSPGVVPEQKQSSINTTGFGYPGLEYPFRSSSFVINPDAHRRLKNDQLAKLPVNDSPGVVPEQKQSSINVTLPKKA